MRKGTSIADPAIIAIEELICEGSSFDDIYVRLELMDADLHTLIYKSTAPLADYQMQRVAFQVLCGLLCLRHARVIHREHF